MTDLIERIRQKLVDRIAGIIDDHPLPPKNSDVACSCGAQRLPSHSHHVADEIVHQLGLMPDTIDELNKRIRYASATLNWELTKLEGIQS